MMSVAMNASGMLNGRANGSIRKSRTRMLSIASHI
jgi:hypothetical protein